VIAKLRSSSRLFPALVVLIAGFFSQQVLAHAHLKAATPAADATVSAAPGELELQFSEGIEPSFSGINITRADNAAVKTGKLKLGESKTQVSVPIEEPLTAGKYLVSWHVVSVDGHKTKGQYSFTVK